MQKYNLQCRVKIKIQSPYIGKASFVANNIIDRNFNSDKPLRKLVTDITYLPWGENTLYLSSVMDLYINQIIAYTINDTQDIEFVLDTLEQVNNIDNDCVIHSDQGAVYTSRKYQETIKEKSITMSLSCKGTPADNAPIESFHSCLKSETFYRKPELKSSNKIITQTVIQYIEHYNNTRIQTKLDYMSPVEYLQTHNPE